MGVLGNLIVKIGADYKELQDGINKASGVVKQAGVSMSRTGMSLTKGLTLPLIALGAAATKASIEFNKGMANVASLIPGNIERVKELKEEVQDMSISMGKSTSDVAEGLYNVVSALGDTSDTVKILNINVKAATAGLAQTKDAINLTTAVTKGYGDTSAKATQQVADLAFETVRLGQTTFPELAASIGRVVPLAAALGTSQEELFTGFATLTGVTGAASEVSTQFAAILRAMIKPTEGMTEAIEELGFNTAKSMVEQLGLVGALRELIKTTDGTQESVAKLFGRAEALTAVFSLTGGQADVFDSKLKQLQDSSGALDKAFNEQTNGVNKLGFEWEQLKAKLQVTSQEMGDALAPAIMDVMKALEPLLDSVKETIKRFSEMDEEAKANTLKLIAFAAAIGPVLIGVGKLVQGIGAAIKVIRLLKTAVIALGSTISLVIGAAVLIIGGFVAAIQKAKREQAAFVAETKRVYEESLSAARNSINEQKQLMIDKANADAMALEQSINLTIEAEREKTTAVLGELDKQRSAREKSLREQRDSLEETHRNTINKIREEFGVVNNFVKTRTDKIKESYSEQRKQIEETAAMEIRALNENLANQLNAIDEITMAKIKALDEDTANAINSLEQQIAAIDAKTEEEERLLKEASEAAKIAELEKKAENAKSVESRKAAEQDLLNFIAEIEREKLLTARETEKDILEERIEAVIKEAKEKRAIIEEEAQTEKTRLEKESEEKIKLVQDTLAKEVIELEKKRDEEIRILQEERIAKEEAENAKFNATKKSLDMQIEALDSWLVDQKAVLIQSLNDVIETEEAKRAEIAKTRDAQIALAETIAKNKEQLAELESLREAEESARQRHFEEVTKPAEILDIFKVNAPAAPVEVEDGSFSRFKDLGVSPVQQINVEVKDNNINSSVDVDDISNQIVTKIQQKLGPTAAFN